MIYDCKPKDIFEVVSRNTSFRCGDVVRFCRVVRIGAIRLLECERVSDGFVCRGLWSDFDMNECYVEKEVVTPAILSGAPWRVA